MDDSIQHDKLIYAPQTEKFEVIGVLESLKAPAIKLVDPGDAELDYDYNIHVNLKTM